MIRVDDVMAKLNPYLGGDSLTRGSFCKDLWDMDTMLEVVRRVGKTFETGFMVDANNVDVYESLVYWMMNDPRMTAIDPKDGRTHVRGRLEKGIFLCGTTGTGKSLAMKVLGELYRLNNFSIGKNALRWKEVRADTMCDEFAKSGDLAEYKKTPLLCIQDLGSEPQETIHMGNRIQVCRTVIESRGDEKDLVTMVTSNFRLGGRALVEMYGDRVVSRLTEMCNLLILTGEDRRKTTK